jgi:hypothetical protein
MWYYFKKFNFDKRIKISFTDRAKNKGIKAEYVDEAQPIATSS